LTLQTEIEKNQKTILQFLYEVAKSDKPERQITGEDVRKATNLSPTQINDAVELLEASHLIDWGQSLGTMPYLFYRVQINARGKLKVQKAMSAAALLEGVPLKTSHTQTKTSASNPRNVFVVHGRNLETYEALCNFLRSIDLHPMEWPQILSETGKGSPYIGEILDKAFSDAQAVVILMTPDDEGCLREPLRKPDDQIFETELTPQARLNVLFEAGMAMALFKERAILVELGKLRPFSDISGRHILKLDNTILKRQELAQRLKTAGCPVDISGTAWHDVGNLAVNLIERVTPRVKFILQRFVEKTDKPIKSIFSIRILHPEKAIEKCKILLDNEPLPWWDEDFAYYETTIEAGSGGVVRVPSGAEAKIDGIVTVMDGKNILRREKFEDIVIGKP
jgi:predicted nucleotide-binding protein